MEGDVTYDRLVKDVFEKVAYKQRPEWKWKNMLFRFLGKECPGQENARVKALRWEYAWHVQQIAKKLCAWKAMGKTEVFRYELRKVRKEQDGV